jgi:O-antigen ligase
MIISKIKIDYNKIFLKVLIFIFIFSLVTGPFIPDLIVSVSSLFFIYFMIKKKLFSNISENKIIFFLILFYIYIFFNSFISHNILISLKSAIPFVRFILFALLVSYIFQNKDYKIFTLYTFVTLFSLIFIDCIFQVIYGFNVLGYPLNTNRISGIFGDELILGSFVSRTYGIFIFLLFSISPKNRMILFFYVTSICLIMIILSAERTALAIYIIIIFFTFLYLSFKNKLLIIIILSISILAGFSFYENSYKRIIGHTYYQLTENNNINLFSFRHQLHFITAFEIFKDNVFLGAGIKSFRNLCGETKYVKKIEKIINNQESNKFIAPYDGIYHFNNDDKIIFLSFNSDTDFSLTPKKSFQRIGIDKSRNYFKSFIESGDKFSKGDLLFITYEYKNGCNTHPHSFFMQFLSELGIIGTLFFIIIYFKISAYLFKQIFLTSVKNTDYFVMVIFFATLFPLLPSGNFFNNYLSILTFLPLGLLNLWKSKH